MKWISVDDSLPPDEEEVLVHLKNGQYSIAWFYKALGEWMEEYLEGSERIKPRNSPTHWLPILPPKD